MATQSVGSIMFHLVSVKAKVYIKSPSAIEIFN